MKIQFPVYANADFCVTQSVVLNSCFGKAARLLKDYVDSPHISSITHSQDFENVYLCIL